MNAIVTNSHHFCKGVTLYIEDGHPKWYIDARLQKGKYGTGRSIPNFSGFLKPKENINNFVSLINLIYEFTGCDPDCYLQIKSTDPVTTQDIINFIYQYPLDQNTKFISIGHCGCNMGHCSAITGYKISNTKYETYGDLMKEFSDDYEVSGKNGTKHYEYPDSVWFDVEIINELPKFIHNGYSCSNKIISVDEKINPNEVYLSWSFAR